jgi:hypothetical protein
MDLRVRSPEEIRRDALSAAGQKLAASCLPCAERHAAIAASHGARRRNLIKAGEARPLFHTEWGWQSLSRQTI